MSRAITFSRYFPAYHPKAGHPTFFVDAILNHLRPTDVTKSKYLHSLPDPVKEIVNDFHILHGEFLKHHTIRAGNRWKVGDKFSPRVWSGKPYRSKQIVIADDLEVKKIWSFKITKDSYFLDGKELGYLELKKIAENDGLDLDDLESWFAPYAKNGDELCQIICWNERIEY